MKSKRREDDTSDPDPKRQKLTSDTPGNNYILIKVFCFSVLNMTGKAGLHILHALNVFDVIHWHEDMNYTGPNTDLNRIIRQITDNCNVYLLVPLHPLPP